MYTAYSSYLDRFLSVMHFAHCLQDIRRLGNDVLRKIAGCMDPGARKNFYTSCKCLTAAGKFTHTFMLPRCGRRYRHGQSKEVCPSWATNLEELHVHIHFPVPQYIIMNLLGAAARPRNRQYRGDCLQNVRKLVVVHMDRYCITTFQSPADACIQRILRLVPNVAVISGSFGFTNRLMHMCSAGDLHLPKSLTKVTHTSIRNHHLTCLTTHAPQLQHLHLKMTAGVRASNLAQAEWLQISRLTTLSTLQLNCSHAVFLKDNPTALAVLSACSALRCLELSALRHSNALAGLAHVTQITELRLFSTSVHSLQPLPHIIRLVLGDCDPDTDAEQPQQVATGSWQRLTSLDLGIYWYPAKPGELSSRHEAVRFLALPPLNSIQVTWQESNAYGLDLHYEAFWD
jgi:hypothetical protein